MKNNRMLIVDDIVQVRQDLSTLLALACEVEIVGEAANGEEAIRQVETLQPDVVLLDLEMPVMDGYQAARRIKEIRPTCRVIALTVHAYAEARQKAQQAGVDAFFVKGEPLERLVDEIMKRKD